MLTSCSDSPRGKSTPRLTRVFGPRDTAWQTGSTCVLVQKNIMSVPNLSRGPVEGSQGRGGYREVSGRAYLGERERESPYLIMQPLSPKSVSPLKGPPAGILSPVGLQGWATIQYNQVVVPKLRPTHLCRPAHQHFCFLTLYLANSQSLEWG